jgi:5'-deoxynucleotidase YfbR-like HD superfamily hydrolase
MSNELITLFHKVGELKEIKRAGWNRAGIPNCESVSDHSFRCTFFAMILGDMVDVDLERLLKMALIHDLAECEVGDITPYDGISGQEKAQKENQAMEQIFKELPNGENYINLWSEYQMQETKEAVLARNLDKLEMAFQAVEYQKKFPELDLSEFINEAQARIDVPEIQKLLNELKMQVKATSL